MTVRGLKSQRLFGRVNGFLFILFVTAFSGLQVFQSVAASAPSAPQYVEAMVDSTQVAVTWDPPSSNGGDSLLSYTVRVWSLPPPTNSPIFASCSTINLGCVVGGLVSGSPYYVDVFASNSAGVGTPSAAKPISPGGTGKPPSNVSATSDNKGLLTIKWTPSTSLGTGTFAWYTAEVFTSPEISIGSYSGFCTESPASASNCLIGGLKLGATYYAQVRTVSSLGSSFPSSPRFKITAGTAVNPSPSATAVNPSPSATAENPSPSATSFVKRSSPPGQIKVTSLSKSLRVSWKAPKHAGGMKILGYRVEAFGGSDVMYHTCRTSAKILTCTIRNLEAKQIYNVGVVAILSGEESPGSKTIRILTKR